jgi:hypothetical protein
MKLYEIADSIQGLLHTEEWTDETIAKLDELSLTLEVKADNVAMVIEEAEAFAERCKKEEARIAAMRKQAENRAEWLRGYLYRAIKAAQREEVAHGTHVFRIKKNPPKAIGDHEELTPGKFITIVQTTKIDRAGILKALKEGERVPGWHMEQGDRLEIK